MNLRALMQEAIEEISLLAVWRGEAPADAATITDAYLIEEVDGLPRLVLSDDQQDPVDADALRVAYAAKLSAAEDTEVRAAKIEEIKSLALSRIEARVPALENLDMIALMVEMVQSGMASPPDPASDMGLVRIIYEYAVTRIAQAKTAPLASVQAYDPSTDPAFPV